MSSSDSDDGLCGNITKKLHKIRSKYQMQQYTDAGFPNTSENLTDESPDVIFLGELEKDDLCMPRKTRKTADRRCKRRKPDIPITYDDSIIEIIDDNDNQDNQISYNTQSKNMNRRRGKGTSKGTGASKGQRLPRRSKRKVKSTPIYNIGNTEEYEDQLENVALFTSKPMKNDEVILLNDSDVDENEELSVKVNFKCIEIVKFKIRKFQKLTEIFEHFSKKENISIDNLLFIYDDKIIKPDHTPDSINYNIAKFIDGGVVFNNITTVKNNTNHKISGIKIKFQFEKSKKPIEIYLERDERISLAMIKVAEQLETPLNNLKFEFDGDHISGTETPKDLDMEGEECIDIKIIN